MLVISKVTVRNFRLLRDAEVPIRTRTVLVGENNVGKTSLLELLRILLSPTSRGIQIGEQDFHHNADPETDAIEATVELRPQDGDQFNEDVRQKFYPHVDIEDDGRERLLIHLEVTYDADQDAYRPRARFKKSDDKFDEGGYLPFRRHLSFFMLDSARDVRRELSARGGLWSSLAGTQTPTAEQLERIEAIGEEAGRSLLEAALGDEAFEAMISQFTEFLSSTLWPEGQEGSWEFSAVPDDFRDFVRHLELRLQNPGESRPMPILRHGLGTQGLTVFALFLAYTKALGFERPILGVEEPEAHLHPQAQRALTRELMKNSAQTIVSTHSTFVTDLSAPTDVVLLKRAGNECVARFVQPGLLNEAEEKAISRYIRGATSEFYFARVVLLVEGESEGGAMPVLAASKNVDLDRLGISIVEVSGANFQPFIKILGERGFDIPWLVLCDNDEAAKKCLKQLVDLEVLAQPRHVDDIESRRADMEAVRAFFYPVPGDFEFYMLAEGFVAEYEAAIREVHGEDALDSWLSRTVNNQPELADLDRKGQVHAFISSRRGRRKPELAALVAEKVTNGGTDESRIPAYFHRVIDEAKVVAMQQVAEGENGDSEQPGQ